MRVDHGAWSPSVLGYMIVFRGGEGARYGARAVSMEHSMAQRYIYEIQYDIPSEVLLHQAV
jgi:hypothetical protein